jgi:hypothetical protein
MARAAAAIATALLLLAGCGSGNGSEEQAEEPAATRTATTADCDPLAGGSMQEQKRPAPASAPTIFLTDVQVEARDCSDRVSFTFRDGAGLPGYSVSYEPASTAKIEDGSGRPVEIAGSDFLVVRFMNAMTAEITGEEVTPTYTGPRRIKAEETRFAREVVKTGDFEALVTWVIGLDGKRPFTATASDAHLVVEVG